MWKVAIRIKENDMAKEETILARVNVDALERLQRHGRRITHNQRCSANDALLAVLGEYEKLKREVKEQARAQLLAASPESAAN